MDLFGDDSGYPHCRKIEAWVGCVSGTHRVPNIKTYQENHIPSYSKLNVRMKVIQRTLNQLTPSSNKFQKSSKNQMFQKKTPKKKIVRGFSHVTWPENAEDPQFTVPIFFPRVFVMVFIRKWRTSVMVVNYPRIVSGKGSPQFFEWTKLTYPIERTRDIT